MNINIKRIYDPPKRGDGFRVLVDRLWPRGVSKELGKIDRWLKNVAPSSKLRTWFHAQKIKRLTEFKRRYSKELRNSHDIDRLRKIIFENIRVTLVTAVVDFKHSHIPTLVKNLSKE